MAASSSLERKKFDPIEGAKGAGRWAKWFAYITGSVATVSSAIKVGSLAHSHDVAQNAVNADNCTITDINKYDALNNNAAGKPVAYADVKHQIGVDQHAVDTATGSAKAVAQAHLKVDQNILDAISQYQHSKNVGGDAQTQLQHDITNLAHHNDPGVWTFISEIGHNATQPFHHPLEALAIGLAAAFAANAKKIKNTILNGRIK